MTYIHRKDVFGKILGGLTLDIGTEKIDKDFQCLITLIVWS